MSTFPELLSDLGIDFLEAGHEHCRPGWLQLDCPFCSPNSQHFRLGYNLAFGYCNCWTCGKHSAASILAEATGKPERTFYKLLKEVEREGLPDQIDLPNKKLVLPSHVEPMRGAHKSYLRSRGFDPAEIERVWDVKGIGPLGKLKWRLFIPVYLHGEMVSWTTRTISDRTEGRYRSAEEGQERVSIKSTLYGEDYCRHSILVVEGPTDCWKVGPGTAATLGTAYSRAQVLRISRYLKRIICFDSQPDAQAVARELCRDLATFPGETINVVLDAKDPGSASRKEVRKLRRLLD